MVLNQPSNNEFNQKSYNLINAVIRLWHWCKTSRLDKFEKTKHDTAQYERKQQNLFHHESFERVIGSININHVQAFINHSKLNVESLSIQ